VRKNGRGRAFGFVKINLPKAGEAVTQETFTFQLDKAKLKEAELRDGHYLLRTNLVAEDPAVLWDRYMLLTQIEAAFKCLKSDLGIRPIYHQLERRVDAHILVAFLAYCLTVTLKHRLQPQAPGLTHERCWKNSPRFRCWMSRSPHRWPPAGYATLYRTQPRAGVTTPSTQARSPAATASAHLHGCLVHTRSSTPNVVET